jgi:hypothetical protein
MKAIVVYRPDSEEARAVEEFLRDFSKQTGRTIETLNPDTADGAQFCETYDILEYPSIIAVSDDGHIQNSWPGLPLPTISELSYYA